MAAISVTYPTVNGQISAGPQIAQNFRDVVSGLTDGTKAISVGALSASSVASSGGITGVTDGSSASAGMVGEFLSAQNSTGTTLSNGAVSNITSKAITAGDWDVWAAVDFGAAAITGTYSSAAIDVTNSGIGTSYNGSNVALPVVPSAVTPVNFIIGPISVSLANTTTYYLNAQAGFSLGTMTVKGALYARRKR